MIAVAFILIVDLCNDSVYIPWFVYVMAFLLAIGLE